MFSPNFEFLSVYEDKLASIPTSAEKYFHHDPIVCLILLRCFGEHLAKFIEVQVGADFTNAPDQFSRLQQLQKEGFLPDKVARLFHDIRISGNQAIHSHEGNKEIALNSLKSAWQLSIWLHRTFSNNIDFDPGKFIFPEETANFREEPDLLPQLAASQPVAEKLRTELDKNRQNTRSQMHKTAKSLNLEGIQYLHAQQMPTLCIMPDCGYENPLDRTCCAGCDTPLLLNNRYRPIRFLGAGGFGRTFEAIDEHGLKKRCVIKQLLPKQDLELFAREAKQLHVLGNHPQIPGLLAFFTENNYCYLVQEFIPGQDLHQEILQRGSLSEEEVRGFLVELLKMLKFIHERGVIHRDIKPENIIKKDDGSLVLIDFGISKTLSTTPDAGNSRRTLVGTPGYAPVEQLVGKIYQSTDIYALGVTAIRLLTGIIPTDVLFNEHRHQWQWENHCQVSNRLKVIINKMVAYDHRDRYQSATDVLQALEPLASPLQPLQKVITPGLIVGVSLSLSLTVVIGYVISHQYPVTTDNYHVNISYEILGRIRSYRITGQRLTLNLLGENGKTYNVVLMPSLLNLIPNATTPPGMVGKQVRVMGVKPVTENGGLILIVYKKEQMRVYSPIQESPGF